MVFSSASFIFVFLPVVFLLYSLLPGLKSKNILLTIASLLFYAYGEPTFVVIMVFSVFMNYLFARRISAIKTGSLEEDRKKKQARNVCATCVGFNIAFIGVFKYAGFAVESLNAVTGLNLHVPEITLPIGISFFTFQALSYVVDVYRNPETVQKNFGKVLLYISFFPQLIAGPIVKYHDIAQYLEERKADLTEIRCGMQRFIIGLTKKMLLANTMGAVADQMFALAPGDMSAGTAWIGAVCYCMQIFFDFSGYSDMAIGIGHMFGFTFKENFDHPYISTSIREFWRRWHISLSTWFREYLYIPMGGNRKGKGRTLINKLIVFFCTGLWHGASWNFVVWGMIHGVSMVIEDALGIREKLGRFKFIGWIYSMLIVIVAFVLFRADTFGQGLTVIANMFTGGMGNDAAVNACVTALNPYNITMFIAACFVCAPHPKIKAALMERSEIVAGVFTLALFALCILDLATGSFNPFIYFRF